MTTLELHPTTGPTPTDPTDLAEHLMRTGTVGLFSRIEDGGRFTYLTVATMPLHLGADTDAAFEVLAPLWADGARRVAVRVPWVLAVERRGPVPLPAPPRPTDPTTGCPVVSAVAWAELCWAVLCRDGDAAGMRGTQLDELRGNGLVGNRGASRPPQWWVTTGGNALVAVNQYRAAARR